jgi:ATP-dependent DNA helicase RecG
MEQALEAMRRSVNEPRTDDKVCPKVGAVLWKREGIVEVAYRGELRWGDHAEYTLLERKNRDQVLENAFLFTTMEPCAPGARRHPKLSCAERIVLARIKEVWVGIEDPDPTVDRKGIKYLQDSGVVVHMFDRDLQESIRIENKSFLTQALKRSTEGKRPKAVVLSKLESGLPNSAVKDFSEAALTQYRTSASIEEGVGTILFNRRLIQQGLLRLEQMRLLPTGFGLILFGKEPRTLFPQAGLLGTIHYPDGKDETRDFDGPLVLIPSQVEEWLRNKLPNVIDRGSMVRTAIPAVPFEMIREAIVNALIHRDYDIREAKCQLVVTADSIVVKSPGAPLPPITLEQMRAFTAPMLSRNPELHYVFAKMDMAEERGLGLRSLKSEAEKSKLPLPKYTFDDPYLVLTLFRSQQAAVATLEAGALDALTDSERSGWQWLSTRGRAKAREYARAIGVDPRTAQRHLTHFLGLGLVEKAGAGPATEYKVL